MATALSSCVDSGGREHVHSGDKRQPLDMSLRPCTELPWLYMARTGSVQGDDSQGLSVQTAAPTTRPWIKQKKMDGTITNLHQDWL